MKHLSAFILCGAITTVLVGLSGGSQPTPMNGYWVLRGRKSVDSARIGLWGYSQGAMLLPLVLTGTSIPSFMIAKSAEVDSVTEAAAYSDRLRVIRAGAAADSGEIVTESHRRVQAMIRGGGDRVAVENYIRQNARQHPFMNQTGLHGDITINQEEFEGLYWKGRVQEFRPLWAKVGIPTLALFGEDDVYVDPVKNVALLASFDNPLITTKVFPRANHHLKKSFDAARHQDLDWPRRIDACDDSPGGSATTSCGGNQDGRMSTIGSVECPGGIEASAVRPASRRPNGSARRSVATTAS